MKRFIPKSKPSKAALLTVGVAMAGMAVLGTLGPEASWLGAGFVNQPAAEGDCEHQSNYSPFVLNVSGGEHFDRISFKEVSSHPLPQHTRQLYYEALAEALSHKLRSYDDVELAIEIQHDVGATQPENHLACEGRHFYVDVWRSEGPDRWGFSLWSGCGEDSQFAWSEVPMSSPDSDIILEVEALSAEIAEHIIRAERTGCASKEC